MSTPKPGGLFWHARTACLTALAIVAVGTVGWLSGSAQATIFADNGSSVPWVILLPAVQAMIIAGSLHTPLDEFERLASRRMRARRFIFLCALLGLAIIVTALSTRELSEPLGTWAALRNLVLFTGVALVAGALLGYRHAWIAPATWAILCLSIGLKDGTPRSWALPFHSDDSTTALTAAAILIAVGALVLTLDLLAPWARPISDDAD